MAWWKWTAAVGAAAALVACGGDGPTGPRQQPGLRVVAGGEISDTVLARPVQALVVEVRGADGRLAPGAVVRFEQGASPDTARRGAARIYVCRIRAVECGSSYAYPPGEQVVVDTPDANGRAKVVVRLGTVAGAAFVRMTVPEFGTADSAAFTVRPGAAVRPRFDAADVGLVAGAQATLRASALDAHGNACPDAPTLTLAGGGARVVDFDPATGVVTAREFGTAWVVARMGAGTDSASVRVVPTGRIVAWEPSRRTVRLLNLDGSATRTLAREVGSEQGVFPRFDATRAGVTFQTGTESYGGPPRLAVAVDTAGAARRDLAPSADVGHIMAVRQLADGAILFVGRRAAAGPVGAVPSASLWKADAAGVVTQIAALPDYALYYGGADISPDGKRVAYVATVATIHGLLPGELRALDVATGRVTALDPQGRSPRWSPAGDRVAFVVPGYPAGTDGALATVAADGTGRRTLSTKLFSSGLAWSPDGAYVVGRVSDFDYNQRGLRIVRARDGADVRVVVSESTAGPVPQRVALDLLQPDWM